MAEKLSETNLFFNQHGLIFWQLLLLIIVATLFAFFDGWLGFKSAALGGSAWIIPDLYFWQKMPGIKTIFNTKKMLKYFFINVTIKLFLSFAMVAIILLTLVINKIEFLSGYIALIITSLLISVWCG